MAKTKGGKPSTFDTGPTDSSGNVPESERNKSKK